MSKFNAFEDSWLQHIFENAAIANVGDASGLPASAGAGNIDVSLNTGSPGEGGTLATSEATYTGYARESIGRSASNWTTSSGITDNDNAITFGQCTSGSDTITHFAAGTNPGSLVSMYYGALDASLAVSAGITPQFAAGALNFSED